VVTFNFDDLLEEMLNRRDIRYHSIYLPNDPASREELPIYHVHGFLPRDRSGYQRLDDSLLALSEEGYHTVYRDPFHWSNIVQLNALRETRCLFIGLSITDPNLRRLMESAATGEQSRHYALLKRTLEGDVDRLAEQNRISILDRRPIHSLLRTHHLLMEKLLRELDVQVIWYESHNDLPGMLEGLCRG
jgi:hypothetical protein